MALQLQQQHFWEEFSPLSIEGPEVEQPQLTVDTNRLDIEGYSHMGHLLSESELATVVALFHKLHGMGLPVVFGFVYDILWQKLFTSGRALSAALGEELSVLPAFWAWYVVPEENQAGWTPHRDRGNLGLDAQGKVTCYNSWFALTDANPDNSCVYILPKDRDSNYGIAESAKCAFQSIRALPTKAGSGWVWDQTIFHWGSQSSAFATHPRLSCAMEFQLRSVPAMGQPMLSLERIPNFNQRLHLIMTQLQQYKPMYKFNKRLMQFVDYYLKNNQQTYPTDHS